MSSKLADRNRLTGKGTWTDVGATFAADPPLANLGTPEAPAPNAEFTGTTAEFSFAALDAADAAETFSVQVLALIDHNLPDGALIEFKKADGTLLAARTWRRFGLRKLRSYIILPAPVSLDTIHCKITNVASGTYRIAAAFAGQIGIEERSERGWRRNNADGTAVGTVGQTDWAFARGRRSSIPVTMPIVTYDRALGVPLPGAAVAVPASWDTDNSTSEAAGVYTFTAVASATLLSKTSAVTTGEWHRVTVNVTQDSANQAVISCNIGADGAQALQPGENTIVANATDATLVFTNSGTFTGTLEITGIEQLATGLSKEDAQSRLDESGTHAPIIYFQRTDSQQWIESTAIYGRFEDGGSVEHDRGPYHQVRFSIIEQG